MFQSNKIKIIIFLAINFITWSSSITDQYEGYDGINLIKNNESVRQGIIPAIKTFFGSPSQSHNVAWTNEPTGIYRPLEGVNCAISYQIWKDSVVCHHFLHIGLHLLNTLLIFLILSRLFLTSNSPFWITLLWSVHPLHNESINMLTSAQGYLFGMLWMLSGLLIGLFKTKGLIGKLTQSISIFVLFLTAHLTSEHSIIAAVLLSLLFFCHNYSHTNNLSFNKTQTLLIISGFLSTFAYLFLRSQIFVGLNKLIAPSLSETYERIFVLVPQILIHYFKLFFFPLNLSMDHKHLIHLGNALSLYHISCLLFCLSLVLIIIKNIYPAPKDLTKSAIATSLLFSLIGIGLTLGIIPLYTLAREIYTYIFCLGLSATLVISLNKLLAAHHKILIITLTLISIGFATRSFVRNLDWHNGEVFWLATKKLCPDPAVKQIWSYKLISYINDPGTDSFQASPGLVLSINKELQDFITEYSKAEKIQEIKEQASLPRNKIKNKYGYTYAQSMSAAFYCIGLLLQNQGKTNQAYYLFQIAHKYNPENFETNFWLFLYDQALQISNNSPYFKQMQINAKNNPFLCKRILDALSLSKHPLYLKYSQYYVDKYPNQEVFKIYLNDAKKRLPSQPKELVMMN